MDDVMSMLLEFWDIIWVRAIVIVVIALLAGKLVDRVLCGLLRWGARKSRTDLDDRLIERLHRPLTFSVLLYGLFLAVRQVSLGQSYEGVLIGIIQTLALMMWLAAGLGLIQVLLEKFGQLTDKVVWLDNRTVPLFDNLGKLLIFGAGIYALLVIWNLDVKPWLASAGVVGLALGFAAKDSLAHLFSGLFIIADAPYKLGDYINLDSGERGRVTQIGLRSTRLLTRDDVEITIPNGAIGNAKIINESGGQWEKIRVEISVGVAYGSDIDRVREGLQQAAESVDIVLQDPRPRIRFASMADSSLVFRVLCWIEEPVMRGIVIDALNCAVYKHLAQAKISIPFPQRDVHLYQAASPAGD